jgi:predicted metal-dependent phosphoesterase TrpH
MLSDFHLHTSVSDGELDPSSLLAHAAAHGIGRLAITDHDSLGAYGWEDGRVFEEARGLGIELVVGLELDVELEGREVHLLAYDVDLSASPLGGHLAETQRARRERAHREIPLVNVGFAADVLREDDIFRPGRETLMRAHLIRPLIALGRFASYEEGKEWFRDHVKTDIRLPRPSFAEAVGMIHGAGGWASLAHPGYYWKDGMAIVDILPELRQQGLDGVELHYPYRSSSPHLFTEGDEAEFAAALRARGEGLGLRFTRGSDAHRPEDFDRVYGPHPA